ncbi:hypothetical protein HN51_008690 [Arachis hypogaea]|uniref:protein SODIUM POTASSIUM ROOT DEFECTIVE 2 n=1 Tax=Arachis hypogaea TaxID=3818 RepID=UPI000DEC778E|nr:protein SODIUM POTASSIUM ROOT DEFECTIVE 2 [Arachis hypogaea]QHO43035.1 uncharacterized protein DS421_5g159360 [Arachis hypogaea]
MGKLGKMLDTFCFSSSSSSSSSASSSTSCFCISSMDYDEDDEFEAKPLIATDDSHHNKLRLKDVVAGKQTLAFQLKPKIVMLRVSMHCYGCAKKVEKHISKLEGVSSYKVDLETKMVVVMGDILPFEVLQSVSKVKNAELWSEMNE